MNEETKNPRPAVRSSRAFSAGAWALMLGAVALAGAFSTPRPAVAGSCTNVANAQRVACKHERKDDFWTTIGIGWDF